MGLLQVIVGVQVEPLVSDYAGWEKGCQDRGLQPLKAGKHKQRHTKRTHTKQKQLCALINSKQFIAYLLFQVQIN